MNTTTTDRVPALLVSFPFLERFLKTRHTLRFRNWVLDCGAFTAYNAGTRIDLADYMRTCHDLLTNDPTLVEVFALDVIGDWKASARNAAIMWREGIPAVPCFHYGEPEAALLDMAATYPKIAVGGVAARTQARRLKWVEQVFARVWPKRIHGFALTSDAAVLGFPFHSVDASSWEVRPCLYGGWRQFGRLQVRGSAQDLRGEVAVYLDMEERARVKWAAQMRQLDADDLSPTVRLAYSNTIRTRRWQ